MDDFDLIAWLQAMGSVFVAGDDSAVHLNSDTPPPESEVGHKIRQRPAFTTTPLFAVEHDRHGALP